MPGAPLAGWSRLPPAAGAWPVAEGQWTAQVREEGGRAGDRPEATGSSTPWCASCCSGRRATRRPGPPCAGCGRLPRARRGGPLRDGRRGWRGSS
eukprot:3324386-Pyramimonas_sp.AAC.1